MDSKGKYMIKEIHTWSSWFYVKIQKKIILKNYFFVSVDIFKFPIPGTMMETSQKLKLMHVASVECNTVKDSKIQQRNPFRKKYDLSLQSKEKKKFLI